MKIEELLTYISLGVIVAILIAVTAHLLVAIKMEACKCEPPIVSQSDKTWPSPYTPNAMRERDLSRTRCVRK